MSIRRNFRRYLILFLVVFMTFGSVMEAEAAAIRVRVRVKVTVRRKVKKKKPWLDYSEIHLWKGDYQTLTLEDAGSGVKWSATKKIVRLKKKGKQVVIYQKKGGICTVKAKYKGKTYKCKVICYDGLDNDTIEVSNHGPIYLDNKDTSWPNRNYGNTTYVTLTYWRNDDTDICFASEDPSIATAEFVGDWFGENDELVLFKIYGEKPGTTRIAIYNTYNAAEVEYITVCVV